MVVSDVLQSFDFGPHHLKLYVPDIIEVKEHYRRIKKDDPSLAFPYWSQVWPAAIGLCHFLAGNTGCLENKKVLELAAGLGLPSLLAAQYAHEVCASDHIPEAVELMRRSADYNGILNMQCSWLNWNHLPGSVVADTLLLSDVNYDPASFDAVYDLLQRFLNNGSTVVLSTPQRLMAKSFIDRLLPFCIKQEDVLVENAQQQTIITVLVLKNSNCE